MDGEAALILMMFPVMAVCFIGSEYNPQSGVPHRWFLPYKDPCQCTAIRLGGMNIPASSYRQGAPYYLDYLFLSEDSDEIRGHFNCAPECFIPRPLGMEDRTIDDTHITASSSYNCCPPNKARLNNYLGWSPNKNINPDPWIEVDLIHPTLVSGIITQGYPGTDRDKTHYCVNKYHVSYRNQDLSDYQYLSDESGNIKDFVGNTDANTLVTNLFDASVLATAVRVEPDECHVFCLLRLELLGCRLD